MQKYKRPSLPVHQPPPLCPLTPWMLLSLTISRYLSRVGLCPPALPNPGVVSPHRSTHSQYILVVPHNHHCRYPRYLCFLISCPKNSAIHWLVHTIWRRKCSWPACKPIRQAAASACASRAVASTAAIQVGFGVGPGLGENVQSWRIRYLCQRWGEPTTSQPARAAGKWPVSCFPCSSLRVRSTWHHVQIPSHPVVHLYSSRSNDTEIYPEKCPFSHLFFPFRR